MPQNLRAIRRKIRTVQGIAKITRTMKMVAAAKLRRVQGQVENGRAYWDALDGIMQHVAGQAGEITHPLLQHNDADTVGVLVIGGSRGLCGSYNVSLHRRVQEFIRELDEPIKLWTVGPKAGQFLTRIACRPHTICDSPDDTQRFGVAMDLSRSLQDAFLAGQINSVYVIYTQFLSAINQIPAVRLLLPIEPPAAEHGNGDVARYIYEPPAEELLATLLPRSIDAALYRMMLESAASEEASRMTAMTAATDNAQELITDLSRALNRARQTQITTEILEVISGAEALTSG